MLASIHLIIVGIQIQTFSLSRIKIGLSNGKHNTLKKFGKPRKNKSLGGQIRYSKHNPNHKARKKANKRGTMLRRQVRNCSKIRKGGKEKHLQRKRKMKRTKLKIQCLKIQWNGKQKRLEKKCCGIERLRCTKKRRLTERKQATTKKKRFCRKDRRKQEKQKVYSRKGIHKQRAIRCPQRKIPIIKRCTNQVKKHKARTTSGYQGTSSMTGMTQGMQSMSKGLGMSMNNMSGVQEPSMLNLSSALEMPNKQVNIPNKQGIPSIQEIPSLLGISSKQGGQAMQGVKGLQGMPNMGGMPNKPGMPNHHGLQGAGGRPGGSSAPCDYQCEASGGCTVTYTGNPRTGPSKGKSFISCTILLQAFFVNLPAGVGVPTYYKNCG